MPARHPPPPANQGPATDTFRTLLPNARESPRYTGVATFCRFPRLAEVRAEQRPIDWAVYGAPYDQGVTYRPGARFAPRAIRQESQYIKPVHMEFGVNIARVLSICDAGDAPIASFDQKEALDAIALFAQGLGDSGHTRLLAVGGDHSIAYANMLATWTRLDKPKRGLALLHFDAHLDTVDVISGSAWSHGSVFRRACEEKIIDGRRSLTIGLRGPLNADTDLDFARKQGFTTLTADQASSEAGRRAIAEFIARLGDEPTYLSFDVDCVDPAFAPGTGTPCCGGFTSAQSLQLLRLCRDANIVGGDVVEVLPDRDVSGITALLASHVMFEILALDAARRTVARA